MKRSSTPSLDKRWICCVLPKLFVSRSLNCSLEDTWWVWIIFSNDFFLKKWQSMSKCFILSWKIGLAAIYNASLLSHKKFTGYWILTPNSVYKPISQAISAIAEAMVLNSISAELLAIVSCFIRFQDTKATPNLTKYRVTGLKFVEKFLS